MGNNAATALTSIRRNATKYSTAISNTLGSAAVNRVLRYSFLILSLWLVAACAANDGYRVAATPPAPADGAAVSPDGKARLFYLDGVRVLQLSGSHYEMGTTTAICSPGKSWT